jgi:drug/metabolite transporter (DMT)-like permease
MGITTPDTNRAMTPVAWGALGIVYVVWGSTYLGIGYTIETIPPLLSGAIRFLIAAALLGGFVVVRHGAGALKVSRRQFGSAALVGLLLLTGGNGMVAVAEQHISTGLSALMVASVPLWLVVFHTVTGDRPRGRTLVGVVVGFVGVALLSLLAHGGSGSALGIGIILAASLSWSVGSFLSKDLPLPENSLATSVYEMLAGGIGLVVVGVGKGESLDLGHVSTTSWLALAYLVAFGSLVAFTCYSWLLSHAPLSIVGTYAYVNPAVAVLLGAVFKSEHISASELAGGLIIILGVGIVVSTGRTKPAPPPDDEPSVPTEIRART